MLARIHNELQDVHVGLRFFDGEWIDIETGKSVGPRFTSIEVARGWLVRKHRERGTKIEFCVMAA